MEHREAVKLIENARLDQEQPKVWADLGCGDGVFTRALSEILPSGSTLYAIDKKPQIFKNSHNIAIQFVQADFEKEKLKLPPLNGILMANSLHYIADKNKLIARLQRMFQHNGAFIVIEYDSNKSNPWVPYPVPFSKLQDLFMEAGFEHIIKIGEKRSIYGQGMIYASFIT